MTSHVHIAPNPESISAVRIPAGRADLLIGCDMVVAGSYDSLAKLDRGVANAVINSHPAPTMDFTLNPDAPFPIEDTLQHIRDAVGDQACHLVDANEIATTLMGDSIATNLFMVGYAFQKGFIPLSFEALLKAIELNGVAIDFNKKAFAWGRKMAVDPEGVLSEVDRLSGPKFITPPTDDLNEMLSRRESFLKDYQNEAYAKHYRTLVNKIAAKDEQFGSDKRLTTAIAKSLFKLMAYKDEYEVARLYAGTDFVKRVDQMMEGDYTLKFNLAPPAFSKKDRNTGHLKKSEYGPWMLKAFGILSKFKFLRGTAFDPFGYMNERKEERRLIKEFEQDLHKILDGLNSENYTIAVELIELVTKVRGYGHIKEQAIETYYKERQHLMEQFNNPSPLKTAAE